MRLAHLNLALAALTLTIAFHTNAATRDNAYVICSKGENPDQNHPISVAMQLTPIDGYIGFHNVTYQIEVRDKEGYAQMMERTAHVNRCGVVTKGKSKIIKQAKCISNDAASFLGEKTIDKLLIQKLKNGTYTIQLNRTEFRAKANPTGPSDFAMIQSKVDVEYLGGGFECGIFKMPSEK